MVKKSVILCSLALLTVALVGCSKKATPTTMAYRTYPTECISRDASGTLTLRVWGEGADSKQARDNAVAKAVEEVIFTNLTGNKANALAIIPGTDVRYKNREYFNKFFKDRQYRNFVKKENPEKDSELTGNNRIVVPVIVTIDREGLVDRFRKDKVLE